MSHRRILVAFTIVAWAVGAGAAEKPPHGTLAVRVVEGQSLQPIDSATVIVTRADGEPFVVSGATDANGWFRASAPPGDYALLAIFGEARWLRSPIHVAVDQTSEIAGVLVVDPEITVVHEHL